MKKKILLILPIVLLVISLSFFLYNKKEYKIERVLKTDYYSYLPTEAKEVIREVYDKTGEIILTEKNKKEDTPYLNPQYIEYLQLSDAQKKNVEVIPEMYNLEYDYSKEDFKGSNLESSYDLRNYNYITPLKDQGSLGICWTFSAVEQAESLLMMKNHQSYNSSTKIFSPRQIDYATSTNGITLYNNEHGLRELESGGNFYYSSDIMSYGLSLIDETKMPYSSSSPTKELYEVLNFANSNYEVNKTISLPKISERQLVDYTGTVDELKANYIQTIKEGVKYYGGAVVETLSPDRSCGFKNTDNTYAIETNSTCYNTEDGHSMQIIGWNDNYNYSYCINENTNQSVNSNNTCTSGTRVTGQGAFIVRNSWGNHTQSYVYLTYNSINGNNSSAKVHFITDMTPTSERTWDNYYVRDIDYSGYLYFNTQISNDFEKKVSGNEKLEKVKFNGYSNDTQVSIKIITNNNIYNYNNIVNVNYPGIYTIDLSDKNIVLDDDFSIILTSNSSNGYMIVNSIAAFTSNVNSTPIIERDSLENISLQNQTLISQRIVYNTKNINSNETINFTLKKVTGEDYSAYLSVFNNKVGNNRLNPGIQILPLPIGDYKLIASYGTATDELNISVDSPNANITYYANNGTSDYQIATVKKNTSFTIIANPYTKTGYKFKEWNTKADGTGTSYQALNTITNGISSSMNLYAIWTPINYSIKFNSNGGSGTMSNQSMTYDVSKTLNKSQFTRTNYKFKEWNTNSSGTGTAYQDEQSVINLTTEENKVINLYAIWEEKRLQITSNPTSINYGEVYNDFSSYVRRYVTIKNTGNINVKLSINNPTSSGPFGSLSFENGKVLTPGEEYQVILVANPNGTYHDVIGTYNGTYKITATSVENNNDQYTVDISATIIIKKHPMAISYTTHVENIGWQDYVSNGTMAGTSGKALRLEGIKIRIDNPDYTGDVLYRTHIENIGWETSFKKNDQMSGTSGRAYRLEAIEIKLDGEIANHYDVYYRVHAENFGWLGWARNGERSGTAGYAYRLEGIQIKLVPKGEIFSEYGEKYTFADKTNGKTTPMGDTKKVAYTTHVENIGWQNYVTDGEMAGTSGKALRLEGIKIKVNNNKYDGDILYKTHIENIGWETSFKKNDQMSGTSGRAYRLEAIEIKLDGEIANHYDVYYRVHAENFGWLAWAKNGERSGTAGYAYRLEGIEIVLVNKGESPPPRSNQNQNVAFKQK